MSMDGKLAVELIAKAISDEAIKLYERHEGKFTAQNTLLAVACVELACRRNVEFDNFILEKLVRVDSLHRTEQALEETRKKSKEK